MKLIFTRTNVALALVLISGGVIAASGDWDAKSIDTTAAVSTNPVAANVGIATALNTLNTAATTNTGSLVTQAVLTASGLANVHTAYLTAYQSTISAASHVANISEANALIAAANSNSGPSSSAQLSEQNTTEYIAMTSYPNSMTSHFTGNGTLVYTATGMPAGVSFSPPSFSGTATVAGTYPIIVTATDTANATATSSFNIVVGVNSPPTIDASTPATYAPAIAPGHTGTIHTFVATDPDGDSITYSTVTTGFSINASSGALTLSGATATTSVVVVATSAGGTDSHTMSVPVQNAAAAIAGSDTVVASQLDGVLSAAVYTDLTTNNNCGSNGTTSCLAAFNAAKATTTCVLGGGASATSAQTATYVSCVMSGSHAAVIDAAALAYTSSSAAPSGAACAASVTLSLPGACGHPQWSCALVGSKTPASGYSTTTPVSNLTLAHSFNGSPSTVSYTIRASLNLYSPAYTKDFAYTQGIQPYQPSVQKFTHSVGGPENVRAWNSCIAKGGVLATSSQIKATTGWSSLSGQNQTIVYNRTGIASTDAWSCSGSWADAGLTMVNNSGTTYNGSKAVRSSGYNYRYINSSGVAASSSCKGGGVTSNSTISYWCADVASSCPL
jgi:hypothetical protein